jgi:hypothetical protein
MKFTVATYGTEGDTRPLAALCRALIDAGHEAQLLADRATLHAARALQVPCAPLSGDIRAAVAPEALGPIVGKRGSARVAVKALASIANANTAAWMHEVRAAAEGSDAVIVSALASFVGLSVAEQLRIPAIGAAMIPITPTRDFASPFLRPGTVPGFLHRASHPFVNHMIWRAFRAATNKARVDVCALPPRRRGWTDHPVLYGVSRALLPSRPTGPSTRSSAVNGSHTLTGAMVGRLQPRYPRFWRLASRRSTSVSAAWPVLIATDWSVRWSPRLMDAEQSFIRGGAASTHPNCHRISTSLETRRMHGCFRVCRW